VNKAYLNREVLDEDIILVKQLVKDSDSILATPSNIVDIYDVDSYRNANQTQGISLKAILDTNIVTRVLPFVNGTKQSRDTLSRDEKKVCALMCFLIHSGIETNPVSAFLERPNLNTGPSKEEQDYLFRIADHLPPQIFADLALGKITAVPDKILKETKRSVDSNSETQEDIARTNYSTTKDDGWCLMYMNLLKAWWLYKTEKSSRRRIERYLEWSIENSLSDPVSLTFVALFLSERRLPKMIKNPNSKDPELIFKNLKNVTWDLYHLSFLYQMNEQSSSREIWFLCSHDKLLGKILPHIWSQTNIEEVNNFVSLFYNRKAIKCFHRYYQKTNFRVNRSQHTDYVKTNIQQNISKLEVLSKELLEK
jgi:hypothetical protein